SRCHPLPMLSPHSALRQAHPHLFASKTPPLLIALTQRLRLPNSPLKFRSIFRQQRIRSPPHSPIVAITQSLPSWFRLRMIRLLLLFRHLHSLRKLSNSYPRQLIESTLKTAIIFIDPVRPERLSSPQKTAFLPSGVN